MTARSHKFAATMALVAALASAIFWGRSYWRYDGWATQTAERYFRLDSGVGVLRFSCVWSWRTIALTTPVPTWRWHLVGFAFSRDIVIMHLSYHYGRPEAEFLFGNGEGLPGWAVEIPYWAPTIAFLLIAIAMARRCIYAHRRNSSRQCVNCGYDLRATPDRCPECGTPKVVST